MIKSLASILTAVVVIAGCTSMTGLDSDSSFQCKAPAGVSCQSISGVYANAAVDNLPFQTRRDLNGHSQEVSSEAADQGSAKSLPRFDAAEKVSPKYMEALSSGIPIRKAPFVLRVWVAPYEDEVSDLHDQSYFYTMINSGKWMIEANRTAISNQFKPVYPLHVRGSQQRAKTGQGQEGHSQQAPQFPAGTKPVGGDLQGSSGASEAE